MQSPKSYEICCAVCVHFRPIFGSQEYGICDRSKFKSSPLHGLSNLCKTFSPNAEYMEQKIELTRPEGAWKFDEETECLKCSICGCGGRAYWSFCPNHGGRMSVDTSRVEKEMKQDE